MAALSKLPGEIGGKSYALMWTKLSDTALERNGAEPMPEPPEPLTPGFMGKLSNLDVIAICRAWRRASARTASRAGQLGALGELYPLELAALGWTQPGDKFQVWENNPSWPRQPFDVGKLAGAWATWARIATDLDDRGTKIAPLYLDLSRDGFRAGARETYARLLAEDDDNRQSPALPPAAQKKPSGGGGGWLWLLLAAALLMEE